MPPEKWSGMVAQAGGRGRGFQALAALGLLLAACAAPPQAAVPAVAKTYHSMPGARLPLADASPAGTVAEYRDAFAKRLHAANAGMLFEGPPPNPVRAVIVMRAEIDAMGGLRRLDLVRAPWHDPWLEDLVRQTVRQAGPFPPPSLKLMNGARSVSFQETWLFDYEGRFRLRSLSLPQVEAAPDADEDGR
jgi:protein TonB